MANRFFDQIGGVMTLRLKGKNPERLINMALSRGIYIWDIKWRTENLQLRVRTSGFKALQSLAEENEFIIEVVSQEGWPFYKRIIKGRLGFLGGAAFFFITLYLMSSFVWFIQLSGNKEVNAQKILTSAARHGMYRGAAKWNFVCNNVEQSMLRDLPQLSYVQCEVRGVKVHIKVVEKILPQEDITGPCHIIAAKDGVIDDVLVLEGQANVQAGQVVGKGDILISGIVFPPAPYSMDENTPLPNLEPYPVRARGTVKARIWYEGYGECYLKQESKVYTGRKQSALFFITPWKEICLKRHDPTQFALFKKKEKQKLLSTPLGKWGYDKRDYLEQKIKVVSYSAEEAVEVARELGVKKLSRQMQAGVKITDSHVQILSSPSDSIARVKVSVEGIEDISKAQPFNLAEMNAKN
ncbi:Putative stage IV sporulation YqfD [Syntrophomonas zehnderi OL-4]|uniref:Putative stage IV sporulation YqfD n=1 Tax=Syntrophomonas zehnderi OL-4 TaxID=690567 RepID=A0A0E4C9H5_9FIRM|nr:sporulation protein YqfD [Syntrophomonas zehnderi]CFY00876.1 Putative stage IV sporulation YqfD [Syntrophomonas zehnderi OL-4]